MEQRLELTRHAAHSHFWFRGFRRFVVPVLLHTVGPRTYLRTLDCGSGTGDNLALLSPFGRSVGVDLSLPGVALAHAAGHGAACADVTRLPFGNDVFDLATSFDVLQCVGDDVAAVREMARVLRPGGSVVMTMAALECLRGDHSIVWDEQRRYTLASARTLVERAGLIPVRVAFLFASLVPLMLVTRTAQRLTLRFRQHREDSDITLPPWPVNAALSLLLAIEAWVARRWTMPIGSSVLVVARKPGGGSAGEA